VVIKNSGKVGKPKGCFAGTLVQKQLVDWECLHWALTSVAVLTNYIYRELWTAVMEFISKGGVKISNLEWDESILFFLLDGKFKPWWLTSFLYLLYDVIFLEMAKTLQRYIFYLLCLYPHLVMQIIFLGIHYQN
jgi:hypothetical protein